MDAQRIKISKLVPNTGQIDGLPANPRFIKDEKFLKLVKSVKDDPEMLDLRELIVYPLGKQFVMICGNMRLRAMKEAGFTEAPCKVLDKDTPADKLRAYTVKDNVAFGEHDWDELVNEWDADELSDWGMDLPKLDFEDANKEIDIEGMDGAMVIKLSYPEDEYRAVRDALSKVASTPEQAVSKLLGLA